MSGYTTQKDKEYWYNYWDNQRKAGLELLRRRHPLGWATSFVRKDRHMVQVETRAFGSKSYPVFEDRD